MQWLDPRCAVADLGPEFAATFERFLGREVSPGHLLYNVPIEAIGTRGGTDDVVFRLRDDSGRVVVVHLTWTQFPPESPPWPVTEIYATAEAFAEQRMLPDHEAFAG